MALYTRYVSVVDGATGDDSRGSGSSAALKDSDVIASDTLVITNAGGGSAITKALGGAFSGPPVAGVDTILFTDTVGGLGAFHIASVSGDNKTLTLVETPATGTSVGNPWGLGGYFATLARAALLAPTNTNTGADDHVYVKAGSGYATTLKITLSNPGTRSRPVVYEGYTTTVGDGGRTTMDNSGVTAVGLEPAAATQKFRNFKTTNTGAVSNWEGIYSTAAATLLAVDNCWSTSSASGSVGIESRTRLQAFRCRANTANYGIYAVTNPSYSMFSIVHDVTGNGFREESCCPGVFCIGDTNATTASNGNFICSGNADASLLFCTSYGAVAASSDGWRLADSASNKFNMALGNIFANNGGNGINRVGITASFPLHYELYNDFYANGTVKTNAEDTTLYDATVTDLALDPQFANAAGQDFTLAGSNLKNAIAIVIPTS